MKKSLSGFSCGQFLSSLFLDRNILHRMGRDITNRMDRDITNRIMFLISNSSLPRNRELENWSQGLTNLVGSILLICFAARYLSTTGSRLSTSTITITMLFLLASSSCYKNRHNFPCQNKVATLNEYHKWCLGYYLLYENFQTIRITSFT